MVLPKSAFAAIAELDNYVAELSKKRQARGHIKDGADIFNYLLENKDDDALTQKEYEGNALVLLFAGADTTATVMIFGSYLLCKNPDVAKRARDEVRNAFRHTGEINATNVNELRYMLAVLSEVMRLYPPGPTGLARQIVNKAGQMVAGQHVPYNVSTLLEKGKHDNTVLPADIQNTDLLRRLPTRRKPSRNQLRPPQRLPPRKVARRCPG